MAGQKTILIVEDDKFLRKVYESKLPKEGYKVISASDGEEGLSLLAQNKVDIMLLDLVMPRKTGFEVLEEMSKIKKYSNIPVLVLSNLGQEEDVARAKKLGAKDFLIKSNMSIKEVVEKIKSHLA